MGLLSRLSHCQRKQSAVWNLYVALSAARQTGIAALINSYAGTQFFVPRTRDMHTLSDTHVLPAMTCTQAYTSAIILSKRMATTYACSPIQLCPTDR